MAYKISSAQTIYRGRIFSLVNSRLTGPDGHRFERDTVVHPGASAMIPLIGKDKVLLVRQFRYAAGQALWEIPAGTLDKNEPPARCARRELIEETGYAARTMKKVLTFFSCPGFCTERIHLFVAKGLAKSRTKAAQDADEYINCRIFTSRDISRMLRTNRIKDAKSIIGLNLWLAGKL
ncbi:MAG: NUDIX hydrolase [Candidatus Brocadiia bacterium]